MKKLYWRPSKASWKIHILVAILAAASITAVEFFKIEKRQRYYRPKIRAASLMKRGMDLIKAHRIANVEPLDSEVDPTNSGLIGKLITPITSLAGHLEAKRTTANPNWAAVLVEMIKKAGVKKNDTIAVGFSGSFPALNLAVLAAARALKIRVVAISSASASAWGANHPKLSWLDMERILYEKKLITVRSVAASLGGLKDRAVGMSKKGRDTLKEIIVRNGARLIAAKNMDESIDTRMAIFREVADDNPITLYINVGGGTVSVGTRIGKALYRPGLNRRASREALSQDSVMTRFARQGTPIIHLSQIKFLAARYQIPIAPNHMPRVGHGAIYMRKEYNLWLTFIGLLVLCLALYFFLRIDVGYRIFSARHNSHSDTSPKPMV
jgi:poly-gamma-glutamate system protein